MSRFRLRIVHFQSTLTFEAMPISFRREYRETGRGSASYFSHPSHQLFVGRAIDLQQPLLWDLLTSLVPINVLAAVVSNQKRRRETFIQITRVRPANAVHVGQRFPHDTRVLGCIETDLIVTDHQWLARLVIQLLEQLCRVLCWLKRSDLSVTSC